MANPFALGYMEEQSAAGADYAWRLFAVGYITPVLSAVIQWPGREEPAGWAWLVAAAGGLLLAILLGWLAEQRTVHAEHATTTDPAVTMLIALSLLIAVFAVQIALAPHDPTFRWLLIVPALIIATVGNRSMLSIVTGIAMAAMAVTVAAAPEPHGSIGVEIFLWVVVLLMFRIFAERVVRSFARDTLFGSMSEVTATADALDDGWARMLPLIARYVDAPAVMVLERHEGSWRVLASWPGASEVDVTQPDIVQVIDGASTSTTPMHEADMTAIGVTTGEQSIVALATGIKRMPIDDMYHHYRSNQAGLQLSVLVSRLRSMEALAEQTRTDSLTGLPNRRALMRRLDEEMDRSRVDGEPLCAVMIDLDHFKAYNDTFGHIEGDQALQAVAALMKTRLRSDDLVCRFGGEEFCMVLPRTHVGRALRVLDELRSQMRQLELESTLTISAGVAQWDGGEAPETLLNRADHALYLAKETGRDRCCTAEDGWSSAPTSGFGHVPRHALSRVDPLLDDVVHHVPRGANRVDPADDLTDRRA